MRDRELERAKKDGEERQAKGAALLAEAQAQISSLRANLDAEQKKNKDAELRTEKETGELHRRVDDLTADFEREKEEARTAEASAVKVMNELREQLPPANPEVGAVGMPLAAGSFRTTAADQSVYGAPRIAPSASDTAGPLPGNDELSQGLRQVSGELADALVSRDRLRAQVQRIQRPGPKDDAGVSGVIVYPSVSQGEAERLNKDLIDTENLIRRLTARLSALQK